MSISFKQILFYALVVPALAIYLSGVVATILVGFTPTFSLLMLMVIGVTEVGVLVGVPWLLANKLGFLGKPIAKGWSKLSWVCNPIVWVAKPIGRAICKVVDVTTDLWDSNPTISIGAKEEKIPTARIHNDM